MATPSNLDLRAGVGLLAGALLLGALCTLRSNQFGHLWEAVGTLSAFGVAALARYAKRPYDGEPGPALPLPRVLELLGLDSAETDDQSLQRVEMSGWIDVDDGEPDVGQAVLLFVDGRVMTGTWGDEASTFATSWRQLPAAPAPAEP